MYAELEQQECVNESDEGSDVEEEVTDSETGQIMARVFEDDTSDDDDSD